MSKNSEERLRHEGNKLIKSSKEKSIHGVCGGIAEYVGISPLGVRLIFVLTLPVSFIIYIILVNSLQDPPKTLY
ncbi:PspC domain-containing protein [Bacillus sp. JCM 19041]|uniref:PspC domain-containing protein n=1 Tax=Bacillus sp. JCM 19041 TaxID=1460637 RepID=UPI0009E7538D